MPKIITNDINVGYVNFIKSLSDSSLFTTRNWTGYLSFNKMRQFVKLLLIPIVVPISILSLIIYGLLLIIFLRGYLLFTNKQRYPELSVNAIKYIPEFISQYPMHLYPVVAKSFELAFIKDNINKILNKLEAGIVEFAIGDGTLSNKIFDKQNKITAFDINPYSLVHTKNYQHVSKRIVADCLNPPIQNKGASFIVSLNLLHHVANKEQVLLNWARIAPYALFNENTNYWATGWFNPYMLRLLKLNYAAVSEANKIETHNLQALRSKKQLEMIINNYYEIIKQDTFLNETVFFLCSVCSFLLGCYGPPTPRVQKLILNKVLWPVTKAITYHMAKALIEYDAVSNRSKDTIIFWIGKSKFIENIYLVNDLNLICPECSELLQDSQCEKCGRSFEEKDGMLFLLPKELEKEIYYSLSRGMILGREHL